jgi:cytochrome c biogenesis protein CcmG, thiol:disulfide interchange protein DsbE
MAEPVKRSSILTMLPLLAFAGLAALFLVGLLKPDKALLPSTLIDRPAPRIALSPLDGLFDAGQAVPGFQAGTSADDQLTKGMVTLVNVFASWCAPCHAEHPFLMELSKDSSIRLLGINQKDQPENARRFLGSKGNPYKAVGIDPNGRASIEWGVYGVPETFILRPDGTLAYKLVGPITEQNLTAFKLEIEKAKTSRPIQSKVGG